MHSDDLLVELHQLPSSILSRMEERSDGKQNSFGRGLDVLIAISRNGQSSVAELADELGIPSSTVYRYIRSLRDYALIEESQGTYVPGWRLMEISGQHLTHTRLVGLGTKHLDQLTYQTSETSVLAVRAGSQAICLRQVQSPHPDRYAFRINELLPLHAGAGQRLLLAFAPKPIVDIVLSQMQPYSAKTPDVQTLPDLLVQARRNGFTVSRGEFQKGAVAVSVPVFADGEIACSLTLAGPEERCSSEEWLRRSLRLLKDAADELGQELGK